MIEISSSTTDLHIPVTLVDTNEPHSILYATTTSLSDTRGCSLPSLESQEHLGSNQERGMGGHAGTMVPKESFHKSQQAF